MLERPVVLSKILALVVSLLLSPLMAQAFPLPEFDRISRDPSRAMRYRTFNYLDGLAGEALQVRACPAITRGVGIVLWFTTTIGAASIDTATISINRTIPLVAIGRIWIRGKLLDADRSIVLPKGSKNSEIDYAALSLSSPKRMLFRDNLEGDDEEWQDAGPRRQAVSSHLPPRRDTFHVIACNNDGTWNNTGADTGSLSSSCVPAKLGLQSPPGDWGSWHPVAASFIPCEA